MDHINPGAERNPNDAFGVYGPMKGRAAFVEKAARRAAALARLDLSTGLSELAAIAAVAPFVGVFGTLLGIVGSFRGVTGERSSIMAAITGLLSEALLPMLFGIFISLHAALSYRYFSTRVERFDTEMQAATAELANLAVSAHNTTAK